MNGITLSDGKGMHLTTDKHGLLVWTDDPTVAISFADAQSAARFARMTGGLQEIQKHRAVTIWENDAQVRTEAPVALPSKDEEGLAPGGVT